VAAGNLTWRSERGQEFSPGDLRVLAYGAG
jgi:hypothetical protein